MTARLLRPREVCDRHPGIFNESTMAHWRQQGIGPAWAKLGKLVVYKECDVEAWIEEQFATAAAK